jgi:hypothetical protein
MSGIKITLAKPKVMRFPMVRFFIFCLSDEYPDRITKDDPKPQQELTSGGTAFSDD